MLFYLSLAVVCVLLAVICLWMFRSIIRVSRDTYQVFLPGATKQQRKAKFHHLNPSLGTAPAPWGWGRNSAERRKAPLPPRVEPVTRQAPAPWGWDRNYPGRRPVAATPTHELAADLPPAPVASHGNEALQHANGELIHRGLESSAAAQSVRNLVAAQDPFTRQLGQGDSVVQWTYRKDSNRRPAKREARRDDILSSDLGTVIKPWGW